MMPIDPDLLMFAQWACDVVECDSAIYRSNFHRLCAYIVKFQSMPPLVDGDFDVSNDVLDWRPEPSKKGPDTEEILKQQRVAARNALHNLMGACCNVTGIDDFYDRVLTKELSLARTWQEKEEAYEKFRRSAKHGSKGFQKWLDILEVASKPVFWPERMR